MEKDKSLCIRLNEFLERTKVPITVIADVTGLGKESLYKWKQGTQPTDTKYIVTLNDFFDQVGHLPSSDISVQSLKRIYNPLRRVLTMRLPLTKSDKALYEPGKWEKSGTVVFVNGQPHLVVEQLYSPYINNAEGAVEINGQSMWPTMQPGDRIAISRLENPRLISWGEYYLIIDTNHNNYIRKVFPHSDESIKLKSDNPDQETYAPIIRRWEDTLAVCAVMGRLQKF